MTLACKTLASNVIRIRDVQLARHRYPSIRTPSGGEQFCLFDEDQGLPFLNEVAVAISVPMQEIHGSAFNCLLETTRAIAIVDLRKFPTFTLTASAGVLTRDRIRRCGASYLNFPIELTHIDTKAAEWEVVVRVAGIVRQLKDAVGSIRSECIFLLNRRADRHLFERSLMAAGESTGVEWQIAELDEIASGR